MNNFRPTNRISDPAQQNYEYDSTAIAGFDCIRWLGAIMAKQLKPCPSCGKTEGWWSSLERKSMVFRSADGEKLEHRIFESKRKYCANCDSEITECVSS